MDMAQMTLLPVTQMLEQHGIPCCLVGIAALVFYGAGRVREVSHPSTFSSRGLHDLFDIVRLGNLRPNRAYRPSSRVTTIRTTRRAISARQTMVPLQPPLCNPYIEELIITSSLSLQFTCIVTVIRPISRAVSEDCHIPNWMFLFKVV